jgi:pyruvate formate lyase activating enzyme
MITRRDLLARAIRLTPVAGGALCLASAPRWAEAVARDAVAGATAQNLARNAPVARFWTSPVLAGSNCTPCHASDMAGRAHTHKPTTVRCLLCAQTCTIEAGQRGKCRVRANVNGELRSLSYGRPLAVHVDPIEKKPFFHFLPGSDAYSLGTCGCPLRCKFCQNWTLSQASPEDNDVPYAGPEAVVRAAVESRSPVVAFTYNEPTVFTEYALDIAREAKKRRLRSVMVSCGFMNEAPLAEMCALLDAIKIDLKGYSEEFYRKVSSAELKPVLRSIKQIRAAGVHLEIVNLVVPTLNDDQKALQDLVGWIANELGPDVPLHFTRFHPDYQLLNLPQTPIATLDRARNMALAKGLHYVYVGNVPGHPGNHTYCPKCNAVVIRREAFFVASTSLKGGACAKCGTKIAGVFA